MSEHTAIQIAGDLKQLVHQQIHVHSGTLSFLNKGNCPHQLADSSTITINNVDNNHEGFDTDRTDPNCFFD